MNGMGPGKTHWNKQKLKKKKKWMEKKKPPFNFIGWTEIQLQILDEKL